MGKNWTYDENKYLSENYKSRTDQEIANELGRTLYAVRLHRLQLGLDKYNVETYSKPNGAIFTDAETAHINQHTAELLLCLVTNIINGKCNVLATDIAPMGGPYALMQINYEDVSKKHKMKFKKQDTSVLNS